MHGWTTRSLASRAIDGACLAAGGLTVLDPQSPGAHAIYNLGVITLLVCSVIFLIVAGIIVFSLMRFRWREGEPDPAQVAGNKTVELVWTAIPLVIVLGLFALTARTMGLSDPAPPAKPDLIVIGHQWWWEIKYPDSGVITANEIHIPVGKPLSVRLDSADVLHEFWVPELSRKMTNVPGHPNNIWLQADKPGRYNGVCSEFCGTQHAWMRFVVVAEAPSEFEAWQKAQTQAAAAPSSEAAGQGLAIFQQMTCVNCHAINGTPGTAQIGPNLTHFASRKQIAGGIDENTHENLRRWLRDPQEVKPGAKMPNFNLTDDQITELVSYFETLK